ncbi:MAG: hypothetical protein L3J08_09690 [Flavobacteriaceae bacterium]|nr:hypothetical protein [Flavobacteriaceae bacterium]
MKRIFHTLTIILLLVSCKEEKRVIEKIDFKTEYKFSSEIEDKVVKDTVPWKYQNSASDYTTKGDYKNALIHWDLGMGGNEINYSKEQIDSINLKYSKINATDYIIEEANKNQIVIINEAHHNSFHRVFTKSLLKRLYDIGYTNLGLEALSYKDNLDSLQKIRKHPIQKTGYYIKDPQFGNLLREAIDIGYTIYPYETKNHAANGKPREINQAKNLEKIINANPKEKFLIHCGYDHVLEGKHEYWEKAMAGRLAKYTGINPLTINQTKYSEKSNLKFNHPLLKALNINESSILLDKSGKPLKYEQGEAYSDIAVFHPNTEYIDGRPSWLFKNGNKNVSITLTDIEIEFPIMVLAFKKGEDINLAVPIDIMEVKNKTDKCNLGLKKGNYQIVLTNGNESLRFEHKVK